MIRYPGAVRMIPVLISLAMLVSWITAGAAEPHNVDFWRQLKLRSYQLGPAEAALPLALEATTLLGATDPELRDGIAYEAFVTWVYQQQKFTPEELDQLLGVLSHNALQGLGHAEDDSLFLRSFSVLVLSVLAAEDLRKPFLNDKAFEGLIGLAVTSLQQERDLRGYVQGKGWGHATAHCADLMKFLARNPRLTSTDQRRIVEAIALRLQTAGQVFTWGEDARLALALDALARRPDVDAHPFEAWFKAIQEEHAAVWSEPLSSQRVVSERTQLNALSELAADFDDDRVPAAAPEISRDLRELRAATR